MPIKLLHSWSKKIKLIKKSLYVIYTFFCKCYDDASSVCSKICFLGFSSIKLNITYSSFKSKLKVVLPLCQEHFIMMSIQNVTKS